jgi:hypothetical protein
MDGVVGFTALPHTDSKNSHRPTIPEIPARLVVVATRAKRSRRAGIAAGPMNSYGVNTP